MPLWIQSQRTVNNRNLGSHRWTCSAGAITAYTMSRPQHQGEIFQFAWIVWTISDSILALPEVSWQYACMHICSALPPSFLQCPHWALPPQTPSSVSCECSELSPVPPQPWMLVFWSCPFVLCVCKQPYRTEVAAISFNNTSSSLRCLYPPPKTTSSSLLSPSLFAFLILLAPPHVGLPHPPQLTTLASPSLSPSPSAFLILHS